LKFPSALAVVVVIVALATLAAENDVAGDAIEERIFVMTRVTERLFQVSPVDFYRPVFHLKSNPWLNLTRLRI